MTNPRKLLLATALLVSSPGWILAGALFGLFCLAVLLTQLFSKQTES